jgi:hypothetical protein
MARDDDFTVTRETIPIQNKRRSASLWENLSRPACLRKLMGPAEAQRYKGAVVEPGK